MNIEKTIANLEINIKENSIILRERFAVIAEGLVDKEIEQEIAEELTITNEFGDKADETVTHTEIATVQERGMIEKSHWYEQRTIKSSDDYSQECDKVKAVCSGLFGLFPVENSVDDSEINSTDIEAIVDSDLCESAEPDLDEQ